MIGGVLENRRINKRRNKTKEQIFYSMKVGLSYLDPGAGFRMIRKTPRVFSVLRNDNAHRWYLKRRISFVSFVSLAYNSCLALVYSNVAAPSCATFDFAKQRSLPAIASYVAIEHRRTKFDHVVSKPRPHCMKSHIQISEITSTGRFSLPGNICIATSIASIEVVVI